jgi:hypothetical protein
MANIAGCFGDKIIAILVEGINLHQQPVPVLYFVLGEWSCSSSSAEAHLALCSAFHGRGMDTRILNLLFHLAPVEESRSCTSNKI